MNGKSAIFTPLYLNKYGDTFRKLIKFGHGAPPQAQIRLVFEKYHHSYRDKLDLGPDCAEIMGTLIGILGHL